MASGFGVNGNQGRCYPFWMDYAQCMQAPDCNLTQCAKLREDYFECLHHRKEFERMNTIARESVRLQKEKVAHAKAAFNHKWFNGPAPQEPGAGHH